MIVGLDNFGGGQVLKRRVHTGYRAVMESIDGFDISDGSLVPEGMVASLHANGSAALGTAPVQSPYPFRVDGVTRLVARDSSEAIREFANGAWSSAGSASAGVLADSTLCRFGEQLVIPTGGTGAKLMAYEPGSPGTKIRPLSFKGPGDYAAGTAPKVTASASQALRLFDCDDANVWASGGAYSTVTNSGDSTSAVLDANTPKGSIVAKKSLPAAVGLTGKAFLVIDVMIKNDAQLYNVGGLYANNALLFPSGYMLTLYPDAACMGEEIESFYIPKCNPLGKIHRIAFNLGTKTDNVQGIALKTASFFTPPTEDTYTVTMYSEVFKDDWTHKGNFLMPAVKWSKSPWAEELNAVRVDTDKKVTFAPSNSVITNGGFESGGTGWAISSGATIKDSMVHSGSYCVELDWDGESIEQTGIPVEAGRDYTLTVEPETNIHFSGTPNGIPA